MAIKESDLTTITETDFGASDFVRVLDGDSSRKITLTNFADALETPLINLGFSTGSNDLLFVRTVTSNYTVVSTDRVVLVDTTAGNIGINLPNAADSTIYDSSTNKSVILTIKKSTSDVNKVTLTPTGVQTIDGVNSYELLGPNLISVSLISNGTNWFLLNL